jgi:outer membrane cobalamin receptor
LACQSSKRTGRALALAGALFLSGSLLAQEPAEFAGDSQLDSLLNLTVSSASKYAQTVSDAPSSVTVITAEEIRLSGFRTIEDVLRTVPGFYVSNDHNYGYVGVRGFGRPGDYNSRLLLLINGVTTNDPVFGSAYVGTEFAFDLASVDRIEIVRGPASAVYGTGAMFGVVNLVLRNGENFDGTRAGVETGSYGFVRASAMSGASWGNGWSLMLSGQAQRSRGEDYYFSEFDSPGTNGGMARGLDGDRSGGILGQMKYKGFSLLAGISSRTKDVPTAPFDVLFDDPRTQTVDRMGFLSLGAEAPLSSLSTLSARVYYSGVEYHGQYAYDVMNFDASSGRSFGAEVLMHWDFPVGARLTVGTEFRRIARSWYGSWSDAEVYSDKDVPSSVYSAYVEGEYQVFEQVRVVGGLRFDGYTYYSSSVSPRIALVCTPSGGTTLKLMYGGAYRVPNFYEASYNDPIGGIKPNPLILPERIQTVEGVVEQRITGDLSASVSLYRYTMSNLIDEELDPVDSMNYFLNRGSVRATGVETGIQAAGRSGLRARLSYCYENAEDLDAHTSLTNSPAHIFRCSLGGPLAPWLSASGFIMYESPRLTLRGPWTPGAWTVNAFMSVTPGAFPVRFEIGVRNLFDANYLLPAGPEHVQTSIIQGGRFWTAGGSIEF